MAIPKPPIFRVYLIQLAVLIPAGLIVLLIDRVTGYSLILGGLIQWLPSVYFFGHAYRYQGARSMPLVAKSFYKGEAGKLMLSASGFAVVFALVKPINVLALFIAFLAMVVLQFFLTVRALKS